MRSLLNWIIPIVVALGVATTIALFLNRRRNANYDVEWPFHAKRALSAPEQVLYHRLVKALPDHIVLAQVQLSRFIGITKDTDDRQTWLNRINQISADFVICLKDFTVVAVVELDDGSHDSDRRKAADTKKDRVLRAAGIPITRWQVRSLPDDAAIHAVAHTRERVPQVIGSRQGGAAS
jgi:hypothetical protein